MAACSGCGERDGGIGHGKRRSRTGMARVGGDVQLAGWRVSGRRAPSGWEWNGSQPGQGASDLLLPRPALGKMQGQPACGAGEPSSGPGCGPSPVPPARRRWPRSAPRACGSARRRTEVAYRILDLGVAAMISLQFQGLPPDRGMYLVFPTSGR